MGTKVSISKTVQSPLIILAILFTQGGRNEREQDPQTRILLQLRWHDLHPDMHKENIANTTNKGARADGRLHETDTTYAYAKCGWWRDLKHNHNTRRAVRVIPVPDDEQIIDEDTYV